MSKKSVVVFVQRFLALNINYWFG